MIPQASQGLASLGRNGDSMLVHMSPHEVAGLQGLAMAQGGSLTINPDTGMPEAFNLAGLFSSFLPTIVGSMVAPGFGTTAALMAGAATGAGLAAAKGDNVLMGGLMGGMGGYGGADIGKALAGAAGSGAATGAATGAAGITGSTGEVGSSLLKSTAGGYTPASVINGVSVPSVSDIAGSMDKSMINTGLQQTGNINPALTNAKNLAISSGAGPGSAFSGSSAFNPMQELKTSATGIGNLISGKPGAWEAAKLAGGENIGTKMAMTGAGGILGGLEPSDIYGKPLKPEEDKYDPYATLNLSNDTGLRLYALGGTVGNPSVGGGLSDLYNRPEGQALENISNDGYGIGRLDRLASAESMNNARELGYAGGGAIAFDKGGETSLNLATLPSLNVYTGMQSNGGESGGVSDPFEGKTGLIYDMARLKDKAKPGSISYGYLSHLNNILQGKPSSFSTHASGVPYMAKGGYLDGAGDGMSDSIPATIEGTQPARLADGEFVVPADVVSHLGNGSSKAGSKRLYKMLDKVRHARTGTKKQGREINPNKYLPA